ncbi:MAG: FCD domain-containing protein [Pseudomonadota bacterium]|nr:FCD domain-containing protein [Pseudomonadota bacterium]
MKARAAEPSFVVISPARAVDEIAAQVRGMIADGRLKPGDRLPSERELALRLQVSRNTLREAQRALEHAGLIEMRKGASGGAFVRTGSAAAIVTGLSDFYHLGAISPQQLTEARVWLSELVVRVACERATEQDFELLEANVKAVSKANADGRFDERQKLNREFHVILARSTHNPIIAINMESVMAVLGQFIAKIGPRDNPYTLPSRKRFVKHLRSRDAGAATAEMTRYLRRLNNEYLARWNEQATAA